MDAEVTLRINGTAARARRSTRARPLLDLLREHLAPHRRQEGLRPRPVRRLHGPARRPPRQRLPGCSPSPATAREVTTIEGLGTTSIPLQTAFVEHDAFQCGYCTPGQICSAVGLLDERRARSTPTTIRERMSGNLCRCGAYVNIVAAIARGRAAMREFAYERAARRRRGRRRDRRRTLPGRRHQPRRPDEARRRDAGAAGRRLAPRRRRDRRVDGGVRIGAAARNERRRTPPARDRRRCSPRRCWPAPPASCATSPPSAATCSSAPAARYFQDVTKPCNKRDAGHAAARRSRATTATSRSSATPTHCVATHPSDMAVALAALGAEVDVLGPGRRRARRRSPACTGCPATSHERDTVLEPGELITAIDVRAASAARAPATARSATAPRTRSPSCRSPRSLRRPRRRAGRRPDRARRRRPRALARRARRGGAARHPAADAACCRGGRRRARRRRSRCATTPSRSTLARNLIVAHARGARR